MHKNCFTLADQIYHHFLKLIELQFVSIMFGDRGKSESECLLDRAWLINKTHEMNAILRLPHEKQAPQSTDRLLD